MTPKGNAGLEDLVPSQSAATQQSTPIPEPSRHWGTRVVLPGLIVLATTGLFAVAGRETFRSEVPVTVVPVMVKDDSEIALQEEVVVQAPGWVEADPFPMAASALADGVVQEVLVLEGDYVEKGQVIARLIDDDARIAVQRAEANADEKQAALEVAQANLQEAERNWEHPIELNRKLKTAEARLEETRAEFKRWPHRLARIEAETVYLQKELQRVEPLVAGGSANDIEVIRARQDLEARLAELEVVRLQESVLKAHINEWEAEVEAARMNFRLRIADTRALAEAAAAVAQARAMLLAAEADLDDARLRFERMTIRSPSDGKVMVRLAEPGAKLMLHMDNPHSAQVARLYDPERLQVRVDIPLVDAAKVGVGQPAEIVVDVLPDRVYRGSVSRVVHEADVQKNTLQVKVAINDPTSEIKPEMLARARFFGRAESSIDNEEQNQYGSLLIPKSAVHGDEGSRYVWVGDQSNGTAVRTPITLGTRKIDDWVSITDGLQPGDRVITNPPRNLADGTPVRIMEE